jgi:acetyl esterase/lipase
MENNQSKVGAELVTSREHRRFFAPPKTISEQASALLARGPSSLMQDEYPKLEDHEGWRGYVSRINSRLLDFYASIPTDTDVRVARKNYGGVTVYEAALSAGRAHHEQVVIFLHGGGLVLGGGEVVGKSSALEASGSRRRTIGVDYRNPPDHPYPAALDDCVTVYRVLLADVPASKIVITGRSGGGNLALAMTQRLLAQGIEPPAGVALFSPEADLTESGDTFAVLRDIDVLVPRGLRELSEVYASGRNLAEPELSPLFGAFAPIFPPTFIQSGTRDIFLSNSVMLHRALRRAGVDAELHVWEAMPHGGFGGNTPEDSEVVEEYRKYLQKIFSRQSPRAT